MNTIDLKEIGQQLKEARISKSMTLEQIAEKTKLRKDQVLAIEEGNLSKLPAGPYVKGFVKLYYKAVGLEFIDTTAAPTLDVPVTSRAKTKPMKRSSLTIDFKGIFFLIAFASIISLAAYLTIGYFTTPRNTIDIPEGPPIILDDEDLADEEEVVDEEEVTHTKEMAIEVIIENSTYYYYVSNQESLDVIVKVNGLCWIDTKVDGNKTSFKTGTFSKEEIIIQAQQEVYIRAGYAANITIFINGEEVEFSYHQGRKDAIIRLEKNGD